MVPRLRSAAGRSRVAGVATLAAILAFSGAAAPTQLLPGAPGPAPVSLSSRPATSRRVGRRSRPACCTTGEPSRRPARDARRSISSRWAWGPRDQHRGVPRGGSDHQPRNDEQPGAPEVERGSPRGRRDQRGHVGPLQQPDAVRAGRDPHPGWGAGDRCANSKANVRHRRLGPPAYRGRARERVPHLARRDDPHDRPRQPGEDEPGIRAVFTPLRPGDPGGRRWHRYRFAGLALPLTPTGMHQAVVLEVRPRPEASRSRRTPSC